MCESKGEDGRGEGKISTVKAKIKDIRGKCDSTETQQTGHKTVVTAQLGKEWQDNENTLK